MMLVPVHVLAGATAILAGYVALFAFKGATVHRKSGLIFVVAMMVMALSGAVISIGRPGVEVNLPAGLVTAYLVLTAFLTVQPPSDRVRSMERGAMFGAFGLGVIAIVLGVAALRRGYGGFAAPAFMFGMVAVLAGRGDRRMLRAGGLTGVPRLRRHLWRMCTGLFIAAGSFFLGPPARVPELLRLTPFRMLPLVALAAMVFWLWRLRAKRRSAVLLTLGEPKAI
jgi:uncharacterized membrane protein